MVTNMKNRIAVQNEQVQTHIKAEAELESQVEDLKVQIEELKRVAESATVAVTTAADIDAAGEPSAEVEALKSQLQLKWLAPIDFSPLQASPQASLSPGTSEHSAALVYRSTYH